MILSGVNLGSCFCVSPQGYTPASAFASEYILQHARLTATPLQKHTELKEKGNIEAFFQDPLMQYDSYTHGMICSTMHGIQ